MKIIHALYAFLSLYTNEKYRIKGVVTIVISLLHTEPQAEP